MDEDEHTYYSLNLISQSAYHSHVPSHGAVTVSSQPIIAHDKRGDVLTIRVVADADPVNATFDEDDLIVLRSIKTDLVQWVEVPFFDIYWRANLSTLVTKLRAYGVNTNDYQIESAIRPATTSVTWGAARTYQSPMFKRRKGHRMGLQTA